MLPLAFALGFAFGPVAAANDTTAPVEAAAPTPDLGPPELSVLLADPEYVAAWSDVYRHNTTVAYIGLAMPVVAIGVTFGTVAVMMDNCREFGCIFVPLAAGGLTISTGPLIMGIATMRAGTALWALGRPVDRTAAWVAILSVPVLYGAAALTQVGPLALAALPIGYGAGIAQLMVNSGGWRDAPTVAVGPWIGDDVRGMRVGFAF